MPFVLFKEGSPDAPRLARLYGVGATTGIVIYYEKRDGRTYFIALLAQGECDGIIKVYYKGFDLPEFDPSTGARNWRFHRGTKSTGFGDAEQGRPDFFPTFPTTLSEKCYIEIALSRELSEGGDEPTNLKVIMRGVRMWDYTVADNPTTGGSMLIPVGDAKIYSTNPALEFIDLCVEVGGMALSRFFKWAATWQTYKERCDELIAWQGGNVYVPPTYTPAADIVTSGDGSLTNTHPTGFYGTRTAPRLLVGSRGGYSFSVGVGSCAVGLTSNPLTGVGVNDTGMYVGFGFNVNGALSLWRQGVSTPLDTWLPSDVFAIETDGATLTVKKNGVVYDTSATPLPPHSVGLWGRAAFYDTGSSVTRSRILLTDTDRQVSRYTGHFAFAGVDVPTAIAALMIRTFGCDWFDANGGIGFFSSPSRPVAHRFSYDPTQTVTRSNQVRDKFNFTLKDDETLINFFRWSYRDLDDPLLTIAYDYTDRPALRAAPFFAPLKQSEVVSLGVSNQSEVSRIGEAHARYFTDLGDKSFYVEGQADSYGVTKGSVVELSHDVAAYRESAPPQFLVTEESFLPDTADDRGFVVVPYDPAFYDDSAHGAIQQVVVPDVVSPFAAPPPATLVSLVETGRALPDGTYLPVIKGTVTFAAAPYPQRARVWWKKPTDPALVLTSLLLIPNPATLQAGFELEGVTAGAHQVQVITESLTGVRLTPNFHAVVTLTATGNVVAPQPPASLSVAYDNGRGQVRWFWGVSPDPDIIAYQLADDLGAVKFQGLALEYFETPVSGTVARRVYAINRAGIRSVLYQQAMYTHGGAPAVTSVNLTATTRPDAQGNHTTVIVGTVTFAAFTRNQRARVFVTEPSSSERRTEIVLTPDGSDQATFSYIAQVSGSYSFRVVTEDDFGFTTNPTGVTTSTSVAALTVPPPLSYSIAYDQTTGAALHVWTYPTNRERIAGVQIATDAAFTNVIFQGDATSYREQMTSAGTFTRYIRSVGNTGSTYSTSLSTSVTVPTLPAPVAGTHSYDGKANRITWNWTAGDSQPVSFYEFDDNAGKILATPNTTTTTETPQSGTASYTRRVRSVSVAGIRSGWTPLTFTIPAPSAPVAGTHSYDDKANRINWNWTAGDANASLYQFDDGAGNILATTSALTDAELPQYTVASYTRRVRALNGAGIASAWTSLAFTIPAPAAPVAGTHVYDETSILWRFTAGSSTPVTFDVDDNAGTDLWRGTDPQFVEVPPTFGQQSYTRRVSALNLAGVRSTWTTLTFTIPAPSAPVAGAMTLVVDSIAHTNSPPANRTVEVWDSTNTSTGNRLFSGIAPVFYERSFPVTSRTLTRYVRLLNRAGVPSAFTSYAQTFTAPPAPTVTADTANARPTALPVQIATTYNRLNVLSTVVQVRAAGGAWPSVVAGTSGTYRFNGAPATVTVDYTAGGAAEYRIALEDVFSQSLADEVFTATQSYTFPTFIDGNFDPTSNFFRNMLVKGINSYSGGGIFSLSSAGVLAWTTPIVLGPLPSMISTVNGNTIQIPAGSATLAVGQTLVFRWNYPNATSGANTGTLVVANDGTYTEPNATSTQVDIWLARRESDGRVRLLDSRYLNVNQQIQFGYFIPTLTSLVADIGTATIDKANIASLYADRIVAGVTDSHIVFADLVQSRNFVSSSSATAQSESVVWQSLVNVTALSDGSLVKTGGAGGSYDAGAISTRSILYGDGYVQAAAGAHATGCAFGLSYGDTNQDYADIDFSLSCGNDSTWRVIESGTVRFTLAGTWASTDVFKVSVESGVVKYYQNGTLLYTSAVAPTYPLLVDTSLSVVGNNLQPVILHGVQVPTTGAMILWQNLINVAFDSNDDLYKTASTGWGNAGMSGINGLSAGQDGAVTFLAGQTGSAGGTIVGFSASDTDQNYTSVGWGLNTGDDGNLYAIESGAVRNGGNPVESYATTDVLAVAREGGVIKFRKNGVVIYTSAVSSNGAALIVDVSIKTLAASVKSARLFLASATPQGMSLDTQGGAGEFGNKIVIGGKSVDRIVAGAAQAIAADLRYRGNDYGLFLRHKVTAASVDAYTILMDGSDRVGVELLLTIPAKDADTYANADSIKLAQVRVIDEFGVEVKGATIVQHGGNGRLAEFTHPLRYAHPTKQATYAVRLNNKFGWSEEFFIYQNAPSLSQPTPKRRLETPLELNAAIDHSTVQNGIHLSWRCPQSGAGTQRLWHRWPGRDWYALVDLTSTVFDYLLKLLPAGITHEFFIENLGVAGSMSNVVTVLLGDVNPSAYAGGSSFTAPIGLRGYANNVDANSVVNFTCYSRNATTGTPKLRRFNPDGTTTDFTMLSTTTPSVTDNTLTPGQTYYYAAFNDYGSGNLSNMTNVVKVTAPLMSASDPTGLRVTQQTSGSASFTWSDNAATGAVSFDYKIDDGNYASGWTTIALAVGATSYVLAGLSTQAYYVARVRVADVGTNPSNIVKFYGNGSSPANYA